MNRFSASALILVLAGPVEFESRAAAARELMQIAGTVREAAPTENTAVADVRVEVTGGELAGQVFTTDAEGRFALPAVNAGGFVLEFRKAGYLSTRLQIDQAPPSRVDVRLMPEPREIVLTRSGDNDCNDLPFPPDGVPGLREYARIAVHHDGTLTIRSAQLPFFSNEGYVYRQTPAGWVKNEVDYILVRSPIPLRGGFTYVITFGSRKDLCRAWSLDATHPE